MVPNWPVQIRSRVGMPSANLLALTLCVLVAGPCFAQTAGEASAVVPTLPPRALARFGAEHDDQPSHAVHRLRFSPDGKLLASRTQDQRVQVWDVPSGRLRFTLNEHQGMAVAIVFSPDGRYLVTGSRAATDAVRIWDARTGRLHSKIESPAIDLRYCHDGSLAVVHASRVNFYDTNTTHQTPSRSVRLMRGTQFMSLSPNGKDLFTFMPTARPLFSLHDLATRRVQQLPISGDSPKFATYLSDGRLLAVGTWPSEKPTFRVQLLGLHRKWKSQYLEGHGDVVEDLAFSRDQRFAVTVSWDGTARIWELLTGDTIVSLQVTHIPSRLPDPGAEITPGWTVAQRPIWSTSHVTAVAISDDGRWLATGADGKCDNSVVLWPFRDLIVEGPDVHPHDPILDSAGDPKVDLATSPEALWQRMASEQPQEAYAAIGTALSRPTAQEDIAQRLRVLSTPGSMTEVEHLIDDLDHDDFDAREAAFRRLVRMRVVSERQLRAALTGSTSLEQRLRIQRLLSRELPDYAISPVQRRRLHRLVFLLELMNDKRARELLALLANGHPDRHVTAAARAVLARTAGE